MNLKLIDISLIDHIKYLNKSIKDDTLEELLLLKKRLLATEEIFSQRFSPNLITKYFKGWQTDSDLLDGGITRIYYWIPGCRVRFDKGNEECYWITTNAYPTDKMPYPVTLADFIGDVVREYQLLELDFNDETKKFLGLPIEKELPPIEIEVNITETHAEMTKEAFKKIAVYNDHPPLVLTVGQIWKCQFGIPAVWHLYYYRGGPDKDKEFLVKEIKIIEDENNKSS